MCVCVCLKNLTFLRLGCRVERNPIPALVYIFVYNGSGGIEKLWARSVLSLFTALRFCFPWGKTLTLFSIK